MKKSILFVAVATLALAMTSCQKEENLVANNQNGTTNQEVTNGPRVKSTADLHNTDWTCNMTFSQIVFALTGNDLSCYPGFEDENYALDLNFDGTYAHFTFPDNIEAMGLNADETAMEQIYGIDYEYNYDGVSHTGTLTGSIIDSTGAQVPALIDFTYDDATDVITFILPLFYTDEAGADIDINLPLNFTRNE